jgi:hypothetical protein
MATIEQYGSGLFGVRIASEADDFVGTYRFSTIEEARAFRAANGGQLFRSNRPMVSVIEAGRARAETHRAF